jgi:hypothetical protein
VLLAGCPPEEVVPEEDVVEDTDPREVTGDETGGDRWQMVFEGLDPALLSIWGSSADDIWIVGSNPDDGGGPLVVQWDGAEFRRHRNDADGDLWWVTGNGESSIWMAGSGGLIMRYDTGSETFDRFETPGEEHLFGIFPLSDSDVVAVGGDVRESRGVVWRYDGETWTDDDDIPESVSSDTVFFKVWARSLTDIWIVGLNDRALHFVEDEWQIEPMPAGNRLFTIHGNDSTVVAVGGLSEGIVLQSDGGELIDVTPVAAPVFNGVWVADDGLIVTAGRTGAIWYQRGGVWLPEVDNPPTSRDYHSVYIDPTGGIWAVGGQVISAPLFDGMLAHFGTALSATAILDD